MKLKEVVFCSLLFLIIVGCTKQEPRVPPEEIIGVSELLTDPYYDVELEVQGEVKHLGELFCSCFELVGENGRSVLIWYDTMTEDDGSLRPSVGIEGFQNGDTVIVRGELKSGGTYHSKNDFWASSITRVRRAQD